MQTAPSLDAVDETSTLATFDAAAALADPLPADVLRSNSGFVVRSLPACGPWRRAFSVAWALATCMVGGHASVSSNLWCTCSEMLPLESVP